MNSTEVERMIKVMECMYSENELTQVKGNKLKEERER
jgi:hypothetical protein